MDLQTSHLAAALMSGPTLPTYTNTPTEATATVTSAPNVHDEVKIEKPSEPQKDTPEEEKEEAPSGEEFSDEVKV